jgi:hypothetical protein
VNDSLGALDFLQLLGYLTTRKGCHRLRLAYSINSIANPEFIANADEKCGGEMVKLSVAPDAKSYTVTVGTKGKSKRYETRAESK